MGCRCRRRRSGGGHTGGALLPLPLLLTVYQANGVGPVARGALVVYGVMVFGVPLWAERGAPALVTFASRAIDVRLVDVTWRTVWHARTVQLLTVTASVLVTTTGRS